MSVMLAQSTPISYHTEAFVKTEVVCIVSSDLNIGGKLHPFTVSTFGCMFDKSFY